MTPSSLSSIGLAVCFLAFLRPSSSTQQSHDDFFSIPRRQGRNNSCTAFSSDCSDCIVSPDCVWCMDKKIKDDQPRCDLRDWFDEVDEESGMARCLQIEDPVNEIKIMQNAPLTTDGYGENARFVQISPQVVRMKLRVDQTMQISFKVAQAKQYPVDLYYLMDLSNSMSDDKENIVRLGAEIASAIQNITNDYRIGFGSFVDKEVMPFISLVPGKNCQRQSCPRPYSFQHQMSLCTDAELFQARVQDAPISGNIDNPEGGFDGLAQVMVCGDKIGWRNQSRRVIVFTTDQSSHIALDGKLGGIVTPNDGQCHLDEYGFYTHSTILDYPSIGQINYLAEKHRVNVIWAVTEDQFDLYSSITQLVEGSVVGVISQDSSNIVELIRRLYEAITTTITVQVSSSSSCETKITSDCKGGGNECSHVELGTPVSFNLSVTLKSCTRETLFIQPTGLKDKMLVYIEPICECPCLQEGTNLLPDVEDCSHPECNGHGNLVCGECHCCGHQFFGPDCSCQYVPGSGIDPRNPEASCRPENTSSTNPVCNGRGNCICGECQCLQLWGEDVVISGKFCQEVCDNAACPLDSYGNLCGNHGDCVCGHCECWPPWTGEECGCKQDKDQCRNPESPHLICSDHGKCPCDRCLCTTDWYTGRYCETCETCGSMCQRIKPCVECFAFGDGELIDGLYNTEEERLELIRNCTQHICNFEYKEALPDEIPMDWENCTLKHGSCEYIISYKNYDPVDYPDEVVLHISEETGEKERCPPPPDYLGIFFGVVGAIVCLGLLTVFLWKAFTTIHDRREFARFEAEKEKVKFPTHSNPIFRQATTTVQNPIFNSNNL